MGNFDASTPDDFRNISKLIAKWREQAAGLASKINTEADFETDQSETSAALKDFRLYADNLHLCDRYKMSQLIRSIITRIVIGRRSVGKGYTRRREFFGTIEFDESVWDGDPIEIVDTDVADLNRRRFVEVARYVRLMGRPVPRTELREHYGVCDRVMKTHLAKAVDAKLLTYCGENRDSVSV